MGQHVSRSELEALHARVREESPGGVYGVFGPGSVTWEVASEGICFAAGGRAALLQVALPAVAHAIMDHSAVRDGDVSGRFQRTFSNVFAIVFGPLDEALSSSLGVWKIHERITGAGYYANDPASLMWVHATLMDSAILAHETFLGPMPTARKEAYYAEAKRFAWLFGIGDDVMPPDWRSFREYMSDMISGSQLQVGAAARTICDGLFVAKHRAVEPITRSYRTITAALMPPDLREAFGLRWGRRDRLAWRLLRRGVSSTYPRTPARLRKAPPYLDARRRLAGKPGRDPIGAYRDRLVMSLL